MMRLISDSYIAYAQEAGPFARSLTELEEAVWWLVRYTQGTGVDLYGGYYGPAYRYDGLVFVVDPGHESEKYAALDAWREKDVIDLYRQYQELTENGGYEGDDFIDNDILDRRVTLEVM